MQADFVAELKTCKHFFDAPCTDGMHPRETFSITLETSNHRTAILLIGNCNNNHNCLCVNYSIPITLQGHVVTIQIYFFRFNLRDFNYQYS